MSSARSRRGPVSRSPSSPTKRRSTSQTSARTSRSAGSARRQSQAVGFRTGADDEKKRLREHYREQAERFFRPEFVNRIDRIVAFDALDQTVVRRIARREVGRLLLREGLVRRRLLVEVDDAAVSRLAEGDFEPL